MEDGVAALRPMLAVDELQWRGTQSQKKNMRTSDNRPKVLLGIPNVASGNALGGQLSAAGCQIDQAHTIAECESLLQERKFELIVLDISLNGSEGVDAISFCRGS